MNGHTAGYSSNDTYRKLINPDKDNSIAKHTKWIVKEGEKKDKTHFLLYVNQLFFQKNDIDKFFFSQSLTVNGL